MRVLWRDGDLFGELDCAEDDVSHELELGDEFGEFGVLGGEEVGGE
jgi:hypothetical protein